MAEAAARYLTTHRSRRFKLVGSVDDDSFTIGKLVHGGADCWALWPISMRVYVPTRQFSQVLVAAETLYLGIAWSGSGSLPNRAQLTVQRFSIRLNELGPSAEAKSEDRGGQILWVGRARRRAKW